MEEAVMQEYLDWEVHQSYKKPRKGELKSPFILVIALYERCLASTRRGLDASAWEDYITVLSSSSVELSEVDMISAIQRATSHCPWSGSLWSRYLLIAECQQRPFSDVEQIKHSATSAGVLDRDGLEAVIEVYITWCGYLVRRALAEGSTVDDLDLADVGLIGALESVHEWGKRLYGVKTYQGDPLFRLERLRIQYCTQRANTEQARAYWAELISTHGRGYEFWQQYYLWEMTVREITDPPVHATAVLIQAVRHKGLDWPEKMMEVYLRHCQNYVDAKAMLAAKDIAHAQLKNIAKRRQREATEAAASYVQQNAAEPVTQTDTPATATKRKRETVEAEVEDSANKKLKNDEKVSALEASQQMAMKRDRENTSIIVTNLPATTTKLKLRQFFKEYGEVQTVTLNAEADGLTSTALIEFQSHEDVQSALLRDGKDLDEKQIHVEVGTGLTIYVTNYPPAADEQYIRNLFSKCGEIFNIRFPSLKYNTQRRFCYISFKTSSAATEATRLDGQHIGGRFKLVAKYSDPPSKKAREGATAEGRELHITGIDQTLSEDDIKGVFEKYGELEKVNLLRTTNGASKGAAFVSFENKDDVKLALELDKTKLKSKILNVEVAVPRNFKPKSTMQGATNSASPAPASEAGFAASPEPSPHVNTHAYHEPERSDASPRTMTLINLPDTVNDARVRAIAEPYGSITRLVLRPDHQGAIIEYADVSAAGRASLGLENYEIAPGRKLRTGGLKDLFRQISEYKTDKIQVGQGKKEMPKFLQPSVPVRRPGGRGGLGTKRGLGFASGISSGQNLQGDSKEVNGNGNDGVKNATKSNADFRAMLTRGK